MGTEHYQSKKTNMEKYMTKQVITYSDGTETVLEYSKNDKAEEIQEVVAENVENHPGVNDETARIEETE